MIRVSDAIQPKGHFDFACLWTKPKATSINTQKKERGQSPAILIEQAWPIKDLSRYGFTVNNGARVTGNPERTR